MGFATSKVIANVSKDFHVIMTGRSLEKVESAVSEIEGGGIKGSLSAVHLDVTDGKSIEQAVKQVEEKHGRLDVLVNNAAIGNVDTDLKTQWQLKMDTNVIGPAMVSAAFRPLLLKAPKPYSIYVSSGAGSLGRLLELTPPIHRHFPHEEVYRASKAALNMIALVEMQDFGPKGLKVFAVCPGFVVSNLRGPSEELRTGWGKAGDPMVSGELILSVMRGERDADMGKFIAKDGVYPW